MSKGNIKLMREQFTGKPEEWIEKLISPINNIASKASELDDKGISLTGAVTHVLNITTPDDWVSPTFGTGWSQHVDSEYKNVGIRKDADGRVYLRGLATGSGTSILTFPDIYAPAAKHILTTSSNSTYASVTVKPKSSTTLSAGLDYLAGSTASWFSLDGLSWMASDRSSPASAVFPINIKTSISNPAKVEISRIVESDNQTPFLGRYDLTWEPLKDGRIAIKNIPGLLPNKSYKVTVLVYPE
jgi:hypothetical protein